MDAVQRREDLAKANGYSLRCLWIASLIGTICWVLDYFQIFIVDLKLMNVTLVGSWCILLLAYLVKLTLGFQKKSASLIILFLLVGEFTFAGVMLSYHVMLYMLFPMVCAVMYNEELYLRYTFVLTTVGFLPSVLLGYELGLCDANMLLLTTTTKANHIAMLTQGQFTLNDNPLLLILFFSFPRTMGLIGFTALLHQMKQHIHSYAIREEEIRRQAESDGLTGLNNRRKYQEYLKTVETSEWVAAIYLDVNNLKQVNDRLGHEQGDVLILGLAQILKKHQSQRIRVFRVGGDEFVMVMSQPREGEAQWLVEELQREIAQTPLDFGLTLSAAMGWAEGKGHAIKAIIGEADENMYRHKAEMKKAREPEGGGREE